MKIKISKSQWEKIGNKTGWMKEAGKRPLDKGTAVQFKSEETGEILEGTIRDYDEQLKVYVIRVIKNNKMTAYDRFEGVLPKNIVKVIENRWVK